MNKKALIGIIIVMLIAFLYYFGKYRKGGFNEVHIEIVEQQTYHIHGKHYKGRVDRKEFGALFDYVDSLKNAKGYSYPTCAFYFNDFTKDNKEVEAFIGIHVPDTKINLSPEFKTKTFVIEEGISGAQKAEMVASTVDAELRKYAQKHDLIIDSINFIECYHRLDSLQITYSKHDKLNEGK